MNAKLKRASYLSALALIKAVKNFVSMNVRLF